jgi:hypothetical protein
MVCENVVRDNAKSTYRHMVYIPSNHFVTVSNGDPVTWLLGFPITDADIGLLLAEARQRAEAIYPKWVFNA